LSADLASSSEEARDLAFTAVLRRKGRVLDSLVDHETALRAHLTPPLREQLDDLRRARSEALRRAKVRLMQEPRHAHPSHWAAFISAGDWRSLDPGVFLQAAPASGS
jgi:hypothetical protein